MFCIYRSQTQTTERRPPRSASETSISLASDLRVEKEQRMKNFELWGAAIAQWICLRLPSCRPGFESQVHHLHFFIYSICAIFVM